VLVTVWISGEGRVGDGGGQSEFGVSWGLILIVHMERSQVEAERRGVWGERQGSREYQRGIRRNS
jgi:hypothetical protein